MLVFTIFSRLDNESSQLFLVPTRERMVRDFESDLFRRNKNLREKGLPLLPSDDYEIRFLGDYDTVNCSFKLLDKYEVVPYTVPVVDQST